MLRDVWGELMSYAKKTDRNHAEIRDGLRQVGYTVVDTSRFGEGFPDLIVINKECSMVFLTEVKDGDVGFTKGEVKFYMNFVMPDIRIVTSLEQMLKILEG